MAGKADEGVESDLPCQWEPFTEEVCWWHGIAVLEEQIVVLRVHRYGVEHFLTSAVSLSGLTLTTCHNLIFFCGGGRWRRGSANVTD